MNKSTEVCEMKDEIRVSREVCKMEDEVWRLKNNNLKNPSYRILFTDVTWRRPALAPVQG